MHITKESDPALLARQLIEIARHAPSVHNVQPWYFQLEGKTLHLFVDNARRLYAGDPTTRELWISLGIMFETIIQAAKALGIAITIKDSQTESLEHPIASFTISPTPHSQNKDDLATILTRRTHRGELANTPIPASLVKKLQKNIAGQLQRVEVITTDNKSLIELAGSLTKRGLQLAFSSAEFRHELSALIHPNWTQAHTGLPGFVLNKKALGGLWEKWSVWLNLETAKKAELEARRVQAAPLLLFIATAGDVPSHWFTAGRTYTLVTLELTRNNLYHSTIAAPIEAADYHRELETALSTKLRLQCMLTVGQPPETTPNYHPAPRLTVDELLVVEV